VQEVFRFPTNINEFKDGRKEEEGGTKGEKKEKGEGKKERAYLKYCNTSKAPPGETSSTVKEIFYSTILSLIPTLPLSNRFIMSDT
jgi:hypothetical protein